MPSWQKRGESKIEESGLGRQLVVLKATIGPAADGWEIQYQPGWGYCVVDRSRPHLSIKGVPHEPFGGYRWTVGMLRDVLLFRHDDLRP